MTRSEFEFGVQRCLIALAFIAAYAIPAEAACSCVRGPGNARDRLAASGAVFVGTAVREVESGRQRIPPDPIRTTLVVEKAWKGVTTDTVTVTIQVRGICNANVTPGRTYIVFARASSIGFLLPVCDGPTLDLNPMWGATPHRRDWALAMLDSLGPPAWTAMPPGSRSIDQARGTQHAEVFLKVAESFDIRGAIPELEILGFGRRPPHPVEGFATFSKVPVGFHRVRVYLRSGRTEDHDIWVECAASGSDCRSGRLIWLRTPPSGWR